MTCRAHSSPRLQDKSEISQPASTLCSRPGTPTPPPPRLSGHQISRAHSDGKNSSQATTSPSPSLPGQDACLGTQKERILAHGDCQGCQEPCQCGSGESAEWGGNRGPQSPGSSNGTLWGCSPYSSFLAHERPRTTHCPSYPPLPTHQSHSQQLTHPRE